MSNILELIENITEYGNGSISITGLIIYILQVIAIWKIFNKANISGWKSLIPIYNYYVLCNIVHFNFWLIVIGIIISFVPIIGWILGPIILLYSYIAINCRLAKSFNHSILFAIGLILFSTLFLLILGFGSSKYRRI